MYRVNLTYFKPNGKYYGDGLYNSQKESLWEIFIEVEKMWGERRLPGLMGGHSTFITLIDVPDHPHKHPHLIGVYDLTEE
jgi:hypothetical protein